MKKQLAVILVATLFSAPVMAGEAAHGDTGAARALIKEMNVQNAAYINAHKAEFFKRPFGLSTHRFNTWRYHLQQSH